MSFHISYGIPHVMCISDLIVSHNLELNSCHMISEDLPKTTA